MENFALKISFPLLKILNKNDVIETDYKSYISNETVISNEAVYLAQCCLLRLTMAL